jgi:hypothetical protein
VRRRGTTDAEGMRGGFVVPTSFAIPLTCEDGHAACCQVVLTREGGWNVSMEFDDRIVFIGHCSDWHRVERLCARLESQIWTTEPHSRSH